MKKTPTSIDDVVARQQVDIDPHAAHYVVNLLTLFSRSDELYEDDGDALFLVGATLTPRAFRAIGLRPLLQGTALWALTSALSLGAVTTVLGWG